MSIFDIFSFRKEFRKIFSKENCEKVLLSIRAKIVELAKASIPGQEKKELLDHHIINIIDVFVLNHGIKNKIILWIIEKVKEFIPSLTQIQYDFLKEKVENL